MATCCKRLVRVVKAPPPLDKRYRGAIPVVCEPDGATQRVVISKGASSASVNALAEAHRLEYPDEDMVFVVISATGWNWAPRVWADGRIPLAVGSDDPWNPLQPGVLQMSIPYSEHASNPELLRFVKDVAPHRITFTLAATPEEARRWFEEQFTGCVAAKAAVGTLRPFLVSEKSPEIIDIPSHNDDETALSPPRKKVDVS
eukprot:gnl/Chilomastix_cuspidata/2901.p2 GENE.gnl/Chilomastix_cuspidata/2901~~gnl/Chilomastix_cuspidata/2901.p2  ORF type:complete len:201 (+),score=31.63 gnl/Chilomastix_cuspidata/2901:870-1472(+)